jgi:CDGSH-type Zn-finger protein
MPKITCLPNGPYLLDVDVGADIVDTSGKVFAVAGRPRIALCRCGHSKVKPFCDGAHKAASFVAEDSAPRR